MNKTLYIHIGTGKTGSTAIQEFLHLNINRLTDQGVSYCKSGATGVNHHLLCRNFKRNDSETSSAITENLDKLKNEILSSKSEKHVISSEYFPGLDDEEINELTQKLSKVCNIELIVYLRRQDDFLESWYFQVIKAFDKKLSILDLKRNLIKSNILDYDILTSTWNKFVSKVNVKPYEKKQFHNGNIFSDFMSILDIGDTSLFLYPEQVSNPSLAVEQVILKNDIFELASKNQNKILSTPIEFSFDSNKHLLSPDERSEILSEYRDSNLLVAKKYLDRDYLFMDYSVNDKKWLPVDLLGSGYLDKLIIYLKFFDKEKYELLEDVLVKYLKLKSDEELKNNPDKGLRYLLLASYMRPNGSDIISKLKKLIVMSGEDL